MGWRRRSERLFGEVSEDAIGEQWGIDQFGRPRERGVTLMEEAWFGWEPAFWVTGFGAIDGEGGPFFGFPVDGREDAFHFGAGELKGFEGGSGGPFFGDFATEVPSPGVVMGVGCDGDAGLGTRGDAMAVERRFEIADEHHAEGAALGDFWGETEGCGGGLVAGAGGEDEGGGFEMEGLAEGGVDGESLDTELGVGVEMIVTDGTGDGAIGEWGGERLDDGLDVHDPFAHFVEGTGRRVMGESGGPFGFGDFSHIALHGFAGHGGGEAADDAVAGPEVLVLGQHLDGGQVEFSGALDALHPARRESFKLECDFAIGAVDAVFNAAVKDALGGEGLRAAEGGGFEYENIPTGLEQAVGGPEAGDAAADDQDIAVNRIQHRG